MTSFSPLSQSTAKISDLDRQMIRDELVNSINQKDFRFDETSLTGRKSLLAFSLRYDWTIAENEHSYEVIEQIYVDNNWYTIFKFAILFMSVGYFAVSATQLYKILMISYNGVYLTFDLFLTTLICIVSVLMGHIAMRTTGALSKIRDLSDEFIEKDAYAVPVNSTILVWGVGGISYVFGFFHITSLSSALAGILLALIIYGEKAKLDILSPSFD